MSTTIKAACDTIREYWEEFSRASTPNDTVDRADLKAVIKDKSAPQAARNAAVLLLQADGLFDSMRMGRPDEAIDSRGLWEFGYHRSAAWQTHLAGFKPMTVVATPTSLDWQAKRHLNWLDRTADGIQEFMARLEPNHPMHIGYKEPSFYANKVHPGELLTLQEDETTPASLRAKLTEAQTVMDAHLYYDAQEGGINYLSTTTAEALQALKAALTIIRTARSEYAKSVGG